MIFKTDLELALENLGKAFAFAKALREAVDKSTSDRMAKCAGSNPLAKADALLKTLDEEGRAMREGLAAIEAGFAAAKAAMPDFARHILGPAPRPRSVDPIDALNNGVTLDRFHRHRE